jgi:hypothetical protein
MTNPTEGRSSSDDRYQWKVAHARSRTGTGRSCREALALGLDDPLQLGEVGLERCWAWRVTTPAIMRRRRFVYSVSITP